MGCSVERVSYNSSAISCGVDNVEWVSNCGDPMGYGVNRVKWVLNCVEGWISCAT